MSIDLMHVKPTVYNADHCKPYSGQSCWSRWWV